MVCAAFVLETLSTSFSAKYPCLISGFGNNINQSTPSVALASNSSPSMLPALSNSQKYVFGADNPGQHQGDEGPKCSCGLPMPVRTSNSEKNPGRQFYTCPKEREVSLWTDISSWTFCLYYSCQLSNLNKLNSLPL
jgi:hypothetical protein